MSKKLCEAEARPDYSIASERSLPRQQRRGAVIILGMLALARRSVVADRADVLMKVGLGKLGEVRVLISDLHKSILIQLSRRPISHWRGILA